MHTLLFLHSTFLVVCLVLSAAPSCHAVEEEFKPGGKTRDHAPQDMKTSRANDPGDHGRTEKEKFIQPGKNEDQHLLFGAGTRMMRSNPPPFMPQGEISENSGLPSDEKKKRELAQRVRELLSRLPIIPLSQKPVLEKATLVSTEPAPPSAAPTFVATNASGPEANAGVPPAHFQEKMPVEAASGSDVAVPAPEARIGTPPMDSFVIESPIRRYPWRSAAMAAALFGAHPSFQGLVNVPGGRPQDDALAPQAPAQTPMEDSGTAVEALGITPPQQMKLQPSLADLIAHEDPNSPSAPTSTDFLNEVIRVFDVMTAFDLMVDWIESIRKEIDSNAPRTQHFETPDADGAGGVDAASRRAFRDGVKPTK